jgi:predicted N-acetyltransferase YhbS
MAVEPALRGEVSYRPGVTLDDGRPSVDCWAVEARLRAAKPPDAPRISELIDQLGWSVSPDAVVAELSAAPTTEVVVADFGDQVIGLIAITTRRQFQRAGNLITIDTLVVDEKYRSQGVGQQLMNAAFEAATRAGAQAVELVSHIRRVGARRFYERLGFEVAANYFVTELEPRSLPYQTQPGWDDAMPSGRR